MVSVIDLIKIKPLKNNKPFVSEIIFAFLDNNINKTEYEFIQKHLDNYNLFYEGEFPLKFETEYEESKKQLLIKLFLPISRILPPENSEILIQQMNEIIQKFPKFYEMKIEPFKMKKS